LRCSDVLDLSLILRRGQIKVVGFIVDVVIVAHRMYSDNDLRVVFTLKKKSTLVMDIKES